METIIKVRPSELNEELLNKAKEFIGDNESVNILISLTDSKKTYIESLNQSIQSGEKESNLISFTMEDLWLILLLQGEGNEGHCFYSRSFQRKQRLV